MDAAAQQEIVKTLDPDLAGLLQCKDVSLQVKAKLAEKKVKTTSRLSAMADSRQGVREFCQKSLGLKPEEGDDMIEIASVVDAWEAAHARVEARNKAEAEAVIGGLPKAVARPELAQLRDRFETSFYTLQDKLIPASATLEQHFDMIVHGEWQYLSLKEFASKEDEAKEPLAASMLLDRQTGALKVKKGNVQVPLPKDAEELRQRLRLMAHVFVMCALRYPHVASLKGIAPSHFYNYADFLLGDFVLGLRAKDASGHCVSAPSFELVLSYDFQLRKSMMQGMNAGKTLVSAMEAAMTDLVLKERYFVTPCALSLSLPPPPPTAAFHRGRSRSRERGQRPKGAGKGKGKFKFAGKLKTVTEDGVQICFRFNNPHERCRGQCERAHACQLCLGKHPMHACPSNGGSADKKE